MSQSHAHAHDIQQEVRRYIAVFIALGALTIVTVAVSKLHFGLAGNIAIALIIATVKASLVACYFMHLISEKKMIYYILIFTALNLVGLFVLLIGHYYDPLMGTQLHL